MIRALVIAAAVSIFAPAAIAQTAPAPTTPAEAPAPGEAEFEATAEAFAAKMETMQQEMRTAVADTDTARRTASLDALEARYQPDVDAFVVALETFVNQQAAMAPETERAGMLDGLAQGLTQLRSLPHLTRTQIEQAAPAS